MLREARRSKHSRHYVRLGIASVGYVLTQRGYFDFNGSTIYTRGSRLEVFKRNSSKCVKCGIQGQYFAIERHIDSRRYHMNLYAVHRDGHEVLMTIDHIIPVSRGGPNNRANKQTMCTYCNHKKGNKIGKVPLNGGQLALKAGAV